MIYYALLIVNVFLGVTGQFLIKSGVNANKDIATGLVGVFKLLLTPSVFAGFFLYGLSSLLWIAILRNVPLSIAYPTLSIGYIAIVALSYFYLGEPINFYNILGTFLIIGGVSLMFVK